MTYENGSYLGFNNNYPPEGGMFVVILISIALGVLIYGC